MWTRVGEGIQAEGAACANIQEVGVLRVVLTNLTKRSGDLLRPPCDGVEWGLQVGPWGQVAHQGVLGSWRWCACCPGEGRKQPHLCWLV